MKHVMFVIFTVLWISGLSAHAENLGTQGDTFPIVETDFLDFIAHRLQSMQSNGEWARLNAKWVHQVKSSMVRPHPVELATSMTSEQYHYDPTFIASHDIFNANGQKIVFAGQHVNPLNYLPSFQKTLLFYNDDDKLQRAFVQQYLAEHSANIIKPILIQGNIKEASKALHHQRVYFDQEGRLTQQFHIRHVPAIVTRDGDHLLITIIGQEDLKDD